jgi:hypothetical protein
MPKSEKVLSLASMADPVSDNRHRIIFPDQPEAVIID